MNPTLEWLEGDGRGGFACGTISGEIRRKWHGLLWVARSAPRDRIRVLAGLQEYVYTEATGEKIWLSARWEGGRWIAPDLEAQFTASPFPRWEWTLPDGSKVIRTVWMTRSPHPFVGVRYEYGGAETESVLVMRPILPSTPLPLHLSTPVIRDVLVEMGRIQTDLKEGRVPEELSVFSEGDENPVLPEDIDEETRQVLADALEFYGLNDIDDNIRARKLLRGVVLEIEKDCEDTHTEDLMLGQHIKVRLVPDAPVDLAYSPERLPVGLNMEHLFRAEELRRSSLVVMGLPDEYDHLERQLAVAADRFLVTTKEDCWTILAGYPWFTDWGRDAMISIPGLCLATSRLGEAREIIRHFLEYLDEGIIPNLFPEAGELPMYNTVDATLWLVEMAFRAWTPTEIIADQFIWSALQEIITSHERGTRNHICEMADGLLAAGSPGTQLTWMDIKVNGEVPTPRHGKAVEIQGLWYNAKLLMASAHAAADEAGRASELRTSAAKTRDSFEARFFGSTTPWPADVVDRDAPGDSDFTLRPNVVIPFALYHVIYTEARRPAVLRSVADHLLTPRGLRTLPTNSRAYKGIYRGNVVARDHAYHQGTVWMWILWPWVRGVERESASVPDLFHRLISIRSGLIRHFQEEGCVEQANEIFDGDQPHQPRGCFAQAWSLSAIIEILRPLS
ncbi:hypothetical protein GC173_06925 [bacterium]|nr:hypothetical protein [bacterium]